MSRPRSTATGAVFISHSHRDCHTAVELQKVLLDHGAQTFLDQDTIDAADVLPDRIQEGISRCTSLLLLWSASAAASEWVRREWGLALGSGKKIIPYALDRTPLPEELQQRVFIEANDQQHGNVHLLRAVLGRDFEETDPGSLFPGQWEATVDALGLVHGTYHLELRANGQVEGEGGISSSGVANQLGAQLGVANLLHMRIPFHGSWSYDRRSKTLTIETTTGVVFGQQHKDTIRIVASGTEQGAIMGQDLAGRTWTLRRVGARRSPPVDEPRQRVRRAFQDVLHSANGSPTLGVLLAAVCLGSAEKEPQVRGLPTAKARKVMTAQGTAFQPALKELVEALQRGGWID